MGAIASSGSPRALEAFRDILVASAAIPGAFPPTMMRVEVDGKPYDEMHVDGGASAQVFMYPPRLRATNVRQGRRQRAETTAAEAIRSQATPRTSTRPKSRTANEGPR